MRFNQTKLTQALVVAGVTIYASPVFSSEIRIDGFASIYAGQVLDKEESSNIAYYGHDERLDVQVDSKYGIQFRADVLDGLTATAQVVGRGSNDFDAKVNWAYLTYSLTDALSIKAGRQRIPFFIYSDFLDVGYAYAWAKPPKAVYDLGGFDNIDAINIEHYQTIGDWTSRVNLLIGGSETTIELNGNDVGMTLEDSVIATWNVNYDWLTMQVVYADVAASIDAYNKLGSGIAGVLGQTPAALSKDQQNLLTIDRDSASFTGIGFSVDWNNYLVASEYTQIAFQDAPIMDSRDAWYVMLGYRWNKLTFTFTYSNYEEEGNKDAQALLESVVVPTLSGIQAATSPGGPAEDAFTAFSMSEVLGGIDSAYYVDQDTKTLGVGVRYDFHSAASFNFEYLQSDTEYAFRGGDVLSIKPSLVRVGVDLVF